MVDKRSLPCCTLELLPLYPESLLLLSHGIISHSPGPDAGGLCVVSTGADAFVVWLQVVVSPGGMYSLLPLSSLRWNVSKDFRPSVRSTDAALDSCGVLGERSPLPSQAMTQLYDSSTGNATIERSPMQNV